MLVVMTGCGRSGGEFRAVKVSSSAALCADEHLTLRHSNVAYGAVATARYNVDSMKLGRSSPRASHLNPCILMVNSGKQTEAIVALIKADPRFAAAEASWRTCMGDYGKSPISLIQNALGFSNSALLLFEEYRADASKYTDVERRLSAMEERERARFDRDRSCRKEISSIVDSYLQ